MLKKSVSLFIIVLMSFSALPARALNYDVNAAYEECCTLYPYFIERIKAEGIADNQIISFMQSVRDYLLNLAEPLNEENFDVHMTDAVNKAFDLVKHIKLRDALLAAFPESADQIMQGSIPDEFMPVYNTVKRFILGSSSPVCIVYRFENTVTVTSVGFTDNDKIIICFYKDDCLLYAKTYTGGDIPLTEEYSSVKAICINKNTLAPVCRAEYIDMTED